MAKNIIILLIRRGIGALIAMLCTTFIVKNLSVANYGVYSVFLNTVTMFATFGTLGVEASSSYVLQNNRYSNKTTLVNIFFCAILMMVITALLTTVFLVFFNSSDFEIIPNDSKIYVVIAATMVLFCNIMFAAIMGNMDFKNYSIFTIVPNLSLLLLLYVYKIVVGSFSLDNAILFYTVGYMVSAVAVLIFHIVKYELLSKISAISIEVIKYIYKYGIQSYLSNLITFFNYRINIFIIGYFLGVQDVGMYSTCLVLMELIWLLASTLSSITYPLFSNPANVALRNKMVPVITRTVFLLTFIITLVFYLSGNILIPLLFGDKFLPVRNIFLMISPGLILMAGSKIISADFTAQGKPKLNILINLITLVITIVTNIILIPLMGLNGAALATTIAFSSLCIISLLVYTKMTGTNIFSYLVPRIDDIKMIIKSKN